MEKVAAKLTKGKVTGLVIGNDINRGGAFMKQAGGWVVSAALQDLPIEVEDAARMDGASVFRTFRSVVLPMPDPH